MFSLLSPIVLEDTIWILRDDLGELPIGFIFPHMPRGLDIRVPLDWTSRIEITVSGTVDHPFRFHDSSPI
jgi:hypothetical protein